MSFDTLDDAAEAFESLREEVASGRDERDFVREQLADIKTTLDLILKTLKVDEERADAADAELNRSNHT
jgi:uncharacterized protein (DUF2225 family)